MFHNVVISDFVLCLMLFPIQESDTILDEDEESDYASAEEADTPTITSSNQEPGTENEKVGMFGPG